MFGFGDGCGAWADTPAARGLRPVATRACRVTPLSPGCPMLAASASPVGPIPAQLHKRMI